MLIFFFSLSSFSFSSPLFFCPSFPLFPSPFFSADPNPCADIFGFVVWVVVLTLWGVGVLVLGCCGRGGLCFGGLAVLFGFSCGLGFVVAMAWCLVLVFWVWCFGGGGVRCLMSVFWACVCVCVCGGWCVLAAVVV